MSPVPLAMSAAGSALMTCALTGSVSSWKSCASTLASIALSSSAPDRPGSGAGAAAAVRAAPLNKRAQSASPAARLGPAQACSAQPALPQSAADPLLCGPGSACQVCTAGSRRSHRPHWHAAPGDAAPWLLAHRRAQRQAWLSVGPPSRQDLVQSCTSPGGKVGTQVESLSHMRSRRRFISHTRCCTPLASAGLVVI